MAKPATQGIPLDPKTDVRGGGGGWEEGPLGKRRGTETQEATTTRDDDQTDWEFPMVPFRGSAVVHLYVGEAKHQQKTTDTGRYVCTSPPRSVFVARDHAAGCPEPLPDAGASHFLNTTLYEPAHMGIRL